MVDIAQKIREIRKNLRLTQAQLASAINASQGSVSKWERGKENPGLEALVALGKLSGFNLGALHSGREHEYARHEGLSFIEVIGSIQPGYGVERAYWSDPDRFEIRLPTPVYWGIVQLKGWVVKGASPWATYPTGTVIIAATTMDEESDPELTLQDGVVDVEPEGGDVIVCSVDRGHGLLEVTLKRVVAYEDGKLSLWDLDEFAWPKREPIPFPSWAYRKAPKVEFLGLASAMVAPIVGTDRLVHVPDDF